MDCGLRPAIFIHQLLHDLAVGVHALVVVFFEGDDIFRGLCLLLARAGGRDFCGGIAGLAHHHGAAACQQ